MKHKVSCLLWCGLGLGGLFSTAQVEAQELIYRCGHEYTNQKPQPAPGQPAPACTVLQGVSVTEIKGGKPLARPAAPVSAPVPAAPEGGAEASSSSQEARAILEAERSRALAQRQELLAQYQEGAPPVQGAEAHNHQKYLDRVAELKRQLDRNEADLNGLQHELNRLR
jgi:hypothetical protein